MAVRDQNPNPTAPTNQYSTPGTAHHQPTHPSKKRRFPLSGLLLLVASIAMLAFVVKLKMDSWEGFNPRFEQAQLRKQAVKYRVAEAQLIKSARAAQASGDPIKAQELQAQADSMRKLAEQKELEAEQVLDRPR